MEFMKSGAHEVPIISDATMFYRSKLAWLLLVWMFNCCRMISNEDNAIQ